MKRVFEGYASTTTHTMTDTLATLLLVCCSAPLATHVYCALSSASTCARCSAGSAAICSGEMSFS